MTAADYRASIIELVLQEQRRGSAGISAGVIEARTGRPRPTVNRALSFLVGTGQLERRGAGRAVTYWAQAADVVHEPAPEDSPGWSQRARKLIAELSKPLGTRPPVAYQRSFVDRYTPNKSTWMPAALAARLHAMGRAKDQQPAGTYARKVLEQLLIDLSFYSSRLEGNRKSLLDTRDLFERGRSEADDRDATMLLNHKDAIEFMVDAVPTEGMTVPVIRNLQSLLMRDLLASSSELGAIRRKIVNIQDTVYIPSQVPTLLEEMLGHVVDKARLVRNPIEASFFLWVNIAYLQPFVDGNKRTSRLAANMPLMLANCAPLSFLDVGQHDYARAMLGVYERRDVTLAIELFEWTYRRSIEKYQVVLESMGVPDPLRARYRDQLGEAVRQVVHFGVSRDRAVHGSQIPRSDGALFDDMLREELQNLESYNCARYRLPIGKTQDWIDKGRPQ